MLSYAHTTLPSLVGGCCSLGQTTYPSKPTSGNPVWCETRGGEYMCLPNTLVQAGINKSLQRAINAANAKLGKPLIRVDARIGPETLAAARVLADIAGIEIPDTVEELTEQASFYAKQFAGIGGVAVNADPDPRPAPSEIKTTVPADIERTRLVAGMGPLNKKIHWGWYLAGTVLIGLAAVGTAVWYKQHNEPEGDIDDESWAVRHTRPQ